MRASFIPPRLGMVPLILATQQLRRCAAGATAVELAFVLPIFLWLVGGIIETGWLMTKHALVDRAVANAARFVYTGAASTNEDVTRASLEGFICEQSSVIANCAENIALELTVIDSFDAIPETEAPCRESDVEIEPAVSFEPGASSEIVFMRVCVTTEVHMPLLGLGFAMAKTENGNHQFTSSLAFANEPF